MPSSSFSTCLSCPFSGYFLSCPPAREISSFYIAVCRAWNIAKETVWISTVCFGQTKWSLYRPGLSAYAFRRRTVISRMWRQNNLVWNTILACWSLALDAKPRIVHIQFDFVEASVYHTMFARSYLCLRVGFVFDIFSDRVACFICMSWIHIYLLVFCLRFSVWERHP